MHIIKLSQQQFYDTSREKMNSQKDILSRYIPRRFSIWIIITGRSDILLWFDEKSHSQMHYIKLIELIKCLFGNN